MLDVISKKPFPNPKSWRFIPAFSSKSYIVLAVMRRSVIYCALIFPQKSNFFLLHVAIWLSRDLNFYLFTHPPLYQYVIVMITAVFLEIEKLGSMNSPHLFFFMTVWLFCILAFSLWILGSAYEFLQKRKKKQLRLCCIWWLIWGVLPS